MNQYKMRTSLELIAQEFNAVEPGVAFTQCFEQKCTPAYMPELLHFKTDAVAESKLWQQWYTSASIIITGRSKKGNAVVAFVHTENPLNNSTKILETISLGLENGAGILSTHDFYKIIDQQDDINIFVIDYDSLYHNFIQEISLHNALSHPFVIPFCGSTEIAQEYLQKYSEVTNKKTITIRYGDDAHLRPLARLLYLAPDSSFDATASLESSNYLLGLKENTLFSSRTKSNSQYSLDDLLTLAKQYVPPIILKQYEAQLRILAGTQHSATNYSADFPPPIPTRVSPSGLHALPAPTDFQKPSSNQANTSSNPPSNTSLDLTRHNSKPPIATALINPDHLTPLHRMVPMGRPTTHIQSIANLPSVTSIPLVEKKRGWK